MQTKKEVSLLIRDGACTSNILRIKSSMRISESKEALVRVPTRERIDKIPEDIGYLAKSIFTTVRSHVPRIKAISFRNYQIILDLGQGIIWTKEEEKKVRRIIESIMKSKRLTVCWSLKRKVGEEPTKIESSLD